MIKPLPSRFNRGKSFVKNKSLFAVDLQTRTGINSKRLDQPSINQIVEQLAQKFLSFSPTERKILAKPANIKKWACIKPKILNNHHRQAKKPYEQHQVFAFLKSKPFVALLKGDTPQPPLYYKYLSLKSAGVNPPQLQSALA